MYAVAAQSVNQPSYDGSRDKQQFQFQYGYKKALVLTFTFIEKTELGYSSRFFFGKEHR
jgi:hypothetical protein